MSKVAPMTISQMHKVGGRHIDLVVVDQPSRTMKKGNCRHRGVKRKQKEVLYCGAWDIRSTRETQLTVLFKSGPEWENYRRKQLYAVTLYSTKHCHLSNLYLIFKVTLRGMYYYPILKMGKPRLHQRNVFIFTCEVQKARVQGKGNCSILSGSAVQGAGVTAEGTKQERWQPIWDHGFWVGIAECRRLSVG